MIEVCRVKGIWSSGDGHGEALRLATDSMHYIPWNLACNALDYPCRNPMVFEVRRWVHREIRKND